MTRSKPIRLEPDLVDAARQALAEGRAADAATLLEKNLASGRGGIFARLLLIRAYLALEQSERALALAREVALANPYVAEAALALGAALRMTGALPLAIAEFQRALRLDPDLCAAREALAEAWLDAGEPEKAEAELANCDTPAPALLARSSAMRGRPRADEGYVRHLFDQFSRDYDRRMLAELGYSAPSILRALADLVLGHETNLAVLDLGCGTGLAGAAFRPLARRLVGVDLSPKMLEKSRERGVYDALFESDLEAFDDGAHYDLVLAADTLVYLGDLSAAYASSFRRLAPGGHFLFTVERYAGAGYHLGEKRRWQHSESYLRRQASERDFLVAGLVECVPRSERGVPVEGLACALQKLR